MLKNKVNYNSIAPFYDWLCKLIFGQSIQNAQIESLHFIPPNSTVLIVGGGTGWILDEINKIHPSGLTISYVDISSGMIELSKKRKTGNNGVTFMQEAIENTSLAHQYYDVILTPFILDAFLQDNLQFIFQKLDGSLKANGIWLYSDFCLSDESKWWQRITIKVMYYFFYMVCKIETTRLPYVKAGFSKYKKIEEMNFCKNFIHTEVYQKISMVTASV